MLCKQYLTTFDKVKITGISLIKSVNNNYWFYLKTGYGNAEEQPERSCGFCTETGGDFSSLVLPVLGKTNALNFGVWGWPQLCRFLFMHDFQLANNDVPVLVPLSPFFGNIL